MSSTPHPGPPPEGGSEIQAVLFDYGHTLIHFDEQPHGQLVEAYEKINHLLAERLEREIPAAQILIEKVSRAVDEEIQLDYKTGREEEVEIVALYDGALRQLGLELEPDLIEEIMEMEQEGWLRSIHVGPDVIATLSSIKDRGLRLGVVSNAAYRARLMLSQMETLGLRRFFDGVTFSSEVGVRKPNAAIYRDALRKLQADPTRTIFVGDRVKEDVVGPKRLGMRAVLTREWRQEEDPGPADFVINRLGELGPIIGRLLSGSVASDTYN